MEPIVSIKGLKKYFKVGKGLLHAVDDVNLDILPGQTLGIVGESGCGKSTLGRTVLRLLEPTGGAIHFDGQDIAAFGKKAMHDVRRDMQIIFQDPFSSLDPRMSVYDLISEPLVVHRAYKSSADMGKRVLELMSLVGLAERFINTYPHEMDGGRRQRVGVARALALNPRFIVCDEPVSALDVSIQAQILNLLMDLQDEMSLTYMFITHDLSVVKHISDEIAVMYLGQCVERSTAGDLFKNPTHPYTRALLSAIPVARIRERQAREIIKGEVSDPINPAPGCRFAVRCEQAQDICHTQTPSLHDVGDRHWAACHLVK